MLQNYILGKKAELKKYMKKVMPFVAFMQERVDTVGVSALDTSLPWDEMDVLVKNKVNIKSLKILYYEFFFGKILENAGEGSCIMFCCGFWLFF